MKSSRHRLSTGLACLALALNMPAPALAKGKTFTPTSPWHLEWNTTTCTLKRAFGTDKRPVLLVLERFAPNDSFQVLIIARELVTLRSFSRVKLSFGTGQPIDFTDSILLGSVKPEKGARVPTVFFPKTSLAEDDAPEGPRKPVTPEIEAKVDFITLKWPGQALTLATGPLDKAFAAMRDCTADLVRSWGLDPVQQASLSRPAYPLDKPTTWLRSSDYPEGMLKLGKQALVSVRLLVDAEGQPTDCQIQRSYNDREFNKQTCALLLERARFAPALDSKGEPIASYYASSVRWFIGG